MSLLLYFLLNDFLMVLLYIVYHKKTVKTSSLKDHPLYSSKKIQVSDETKKIEIAQKYSKMKKSINKQRLLEKQK